jgi:hypothetical protein
MKLTALALTIIPILLAQPVFANSTDIECNVLNSGGITLQFGVDPTSGALVGLAVSTAAPNATSNAAGVPPMITNFPISQIANFWVDLEIMKVHGVDPNSHLQSIFISYDRNLGLGKVSMVLSGYDLNNQTITCTFD